MFRGGEILAKRASPGTRASPALHKQALSNYVITNDVQLTLDTLYIVHRE